MSTLSDYSHWNEEAPIIKYLEDRYSDFYSDDPHYVEEHHVWDSYDEDDEEEQ